MGNRPQLLERAAVQRQDPLFGRDISFYVFRLPVLETLYSWSLVTLGLTLLLATATYVLHRGIQITRGPRGRPYARAHLLALGALLLIVKAGGNYLDTFDLLFSPRGVVFGASYQRHQCAAPGPPRPHHPVPWAARRSASGRSAAAASARSSSPLAVLLAANVVGWGSIPTSCSGSA